jgi:deoxyribonucleoside regulator
MKNKKINREELIYKIAKLHYIDKISQKNLASIYNLSTATISRFINEAEELGIVDIKIRDIAGANRKIENKIKEKYDLKRVNVTVVPYDDKNIIKSIIGKSAASLIGKLLRDNLRIGIAWGQSIHEMIKFLDYKYYRNIKVVDLIGNVGKLYYDISASSLAQEFARKINAKNYFMSSLAIVKNKEIRDLIVKEDEIKDVIEMTKDLDIAIISIGIPDIESSIIANLKYGKDIVLEARKKKAVGDICLRFFDNDGQKIKTSFDNRIVGIDLDDYKKIKTKICISGGLHKFEAIKSALKNKLIDILITDNLVANKLLENQ